MPACMLEILIVTYLRLIFVENVPRQSHLPISPKTDLSFISIAPPNHYNPAHASASHAHRLECHENHSGHKKILFMIII
jgi:hypothetical protein